MDDERIERALRLGPPDEPAYAPRSSWQAADAGDQHADPAPATSTTHAPRDANAPGTEPVRPIGVRVRDARRPSRRSFPITIAASLTLLIGLLLAARVVPTGPAATPEPSVDMLARLMSAGSVEIAVSTGAPQAVSQGGAYIGFDVDVAKAIAQQLDLQADVTALAPAAFPAGSWDLALAGHAGQSLNGVASSDPYAWWPIWLAAPGASTVSDIAGIQDARVCVVGGSAGADWLSGTPSVAGGATTTAPPSVATIVTASDDECVAAVSDGRADAMLTATLLSDEVQSRGLRLVDPNPVLLDAWMVVVRGPATDSASLLGAVDDALIALRTSGRLADLSRSSFGGLDVTVPQP